MSTPSSFPRASSDAPSAAVSAALAARAQQASAAALADHAFDATCVWTLGRDEPGPVVEWPASAAHAYALGADVVLGRPRHGPARSRPARGAWGDVLDALHAAGRWEGEMLHVAGDGRRVRADTRLLVVPGADPGDGGTLVVEIARDVTARRAAEAALRASQDRLAAIIDSALDAIVTVDEGQRVVLFNAAAERLFGVPAAEAIGEPLDRFIPPRFRAEHRRNVADFGAAGVAARTMSPARGVPLLHAAPGHPALADRAARPGTVLALRADGTEFPIEAGISQAETPRGRLYTVIVRDVTERVQAEAEREALVRALEAERAQLAESARHAELARAEADAARVEAEAASRAKSAFLATMSHELRTPLNAVLGYAELLELGLAGAVTDAQRRYLDRIAASGRHLLALMDDVLDLSKIEAGHMAVARRRGDAGAAARAALALVRPQAAARGVGLAGDCDAPHGPAYLGDEHRVRQVLINLLSNAVKYTEPGGRVRVTCEPGAARLAPDGGEVPGPWVAVRVADTGIGIPPEHHELVFGRFHQVDHAAAGPYRRTQGGTGLGLAISRELARLMGGELTLESVPGRGSTFTLWLPAADAPAPGHAAPVPARTAVGAVLADAARPVVSGWVDRLRADPVIPRAAATSRAELEDHMAGFLADFAQQFVILDEPAADAGARASLVRDGAAVRTVVAERHGAQRARLGWDEAALAREFALLGEELERALAERLIDVPAGTVDDARALVRALLADAARESAAALRAARAGARAAHTAAGRGAGGGGAAPASSAAAPSAASGRPNR